MELGAESQTRKARPIIAAYYERATIQGAKDGVIMKFVGSMHAQIVSPMTKSWMRTILIDERERMQGNSTYTNELVEEHLSKFRSRGSIGCKNACWA